MGMSVKENPNKKFVVVKGCAGLGNRLVTVLAAADYSKKANRTICIDWSDGQFDKKGTNAFDKCFELVNTDTTNLQSISNWSDLSHTSEEFKKNRDGGLYDYYTEYQNHFFLKFPYALFFTESLRMFRKKWIPLRKKSKSLCFGEDLKIQKPEDVVYYMDFLPLANENDLPLYIQLKDALKTRVKDYAIVNNLDKAVGVHIRHTDKKPGVSVNRIIGHLKKTFNGKPVFLCTDSIEIEKMFHTSLEHVISFKKYLPELKGEGLHQWALYKNAEELKYTIFEESVMDMFLLSECHTLFYQGNSTFSKVSKAFHANKNNCHDWLLLNG